MSSERKKINRNSIIRLTQYKNMLHRLKALGFERIFSDNLAEAVGVTASQVRRDLGFFQLTGNKRGGYDIDTLIARLRHLLGKHTIQKVVVIGIGNVGRALMNHREFEKESIRIVAGFDADKAKWDSRARIPILSLEKLKTYLNQHDIRIAVVCVPEAAAQEVVDRMHDTPVKGILNFAPVRLKPYPGCVIRNVNIGLELETVIYFVNAEEKAAPACEPLI